MPTYAQITSISTEFQQEAASRRKHLNAMIVFISNNDAILTISCNTGRQIKFTIQRTLCAECEFELTIGIKHLYAIVATITDNDVAI